MLSDLKALICIAVITISVGGIYFYTEYQAVKKYYPKITLMEYLILSDKLRITPDGRP